MHLGAADPIVLITVLDLLGIFVFAISGGLVAVRKDLDIFGVLVLAGTTGLGGGFLRDILAGRVPIVLRGELYATPALVGAGLVVAGLEAGAGAVVVAVPAALVCLLWRLLAMRRGWNAPRPSGTAST
jgi:uncharacterized membrane protein YeiH